MHMGSKRGGGGDDEPALPFTLALSRFTTPPPFPCFQRTRTLSSRWQLGASVRYLGGLTFGAFVPPYVLRMFPEREAAVAVYYGLVVMVGGMSASFIGGYLCRLWMRKTPRVRRFCVSCV